MKQTSREAHESIKGNIPNLHKKIVTALKSIKKGTFRQIAKQAGLQDMQVWKRLSELRNDNKVRESGTTRCPVSGRNVTVWEVIK